MNRRIEYSNEEKRKQFQQFVYRWQLAVAAIASVLLIGLSYVLIFRPDLISVVLRYGLGILCGATGFGLAIFLLSTLFRYLRSR